MTPGGVEGIKGAHTNYHRGEYSHFPNKRRATIIFSHTLTGRQFDVDTHDRDVM